ncbi:MAG: hypothetical protein K2I70_06025 [Bacilli bacterium]|nr:hypothetical protein [Bacilli bacterium]
MKKRRTDDENRQENFIDVFIRNWKNVPGFRSVIKLSLYLIFIFIFIVVVNVAGNKTGTKRHNSNNAISSTTKAIETITYKDVLENVVKNKKDVYMEIVIDGIKARVDAVTNDDNITGYYETDRLTKKFKIDNNVLYEVTLDHEIENDKILNGLNIDFIVPANMIDILKNNIPTKMINNEEVLYNYDISINNIAYKVTTTVKESVLTNIEIISEKEKYTIVYE